MGGALVSYLLLVKCTEPFRVRVRSKEFEVPQGELVYVGSCRVNCDKRVSRHFSKDKRSFWHIDYLLNNCEALSALLTPLEEAELAKAFEGCEYVAGFGSSDDPLNPSHLFVCDFKEAVIRALRVTHNYKSRG